MYIPINKILDKYNIIPRGVIQVGAHWAEEHSHYLQCGVEKFVYIEPCKAAYSIMKTKVGSSEDDILLLNVACGAEEGEVQMYISHQNQGQSNSILKSKLHSVQHPEIIFDDTEMVRMVTLDSLPIKKEDYNILVTDCEGYDGEVMKGAKETLKHIDLIYSEVNCGETRIGNMLIEDFDELLWQEGFIRVEVFWPGRFLTWGDAIYVRNEFAIKQLTSEDLDML